MRYSASTAMYSHLTHFSWMIPASFLQIPKAHCNHLGTTPKMNMKKILTYSVHRVMRRYSEHYTCRKSLTAGSPSCSSNVNCKLQM